MTHKKIISEILKNIRSDWLPSQTAVVMATQGVLELYQMMAANEECPFEYITTSKFTSEGSENQFSSLRQKTGEQNPGPLKTKQSLRVDAMTQSVTPARGANYRSTCDTTALTLADIAPHPKVNQHALPVRPPGPEALPPALVNHSVVTKQGNFFIKIIF